MREAITWYRVIDGVHIWRAALDDPRWSGPAELPAPERERAANILRERDARRWVASRWALRCVLGRYLEIAADAVELELGANGKPRLRHGRGPEFNLSHSEGLALVAVAERPVGVDVEAIRPGRDLLALAERALPPEDATAVRAAEESGRAEVFYAAWARHEARLKCLGARAPGVPIAVEAVEVAPGYAAAVAVSGAAVGPLLCRSPWGG